MNKSIPKTDTDKKIIESSNMTEPPPKNIKHLASLCYNSTLYKCKQIICSHNRPLLAFPYCATYSDDTKLLSLFESPYCKPNVHKTTAHNQIILPRNLSKVNCYMCGPLNRKGTGVGAGAAWRRSIFGNRPRPQNYARAQYGCLPCYF